MAVKTSPFTGWRLSGKDAEAFSRQIEASQPNMLAQKALVRGRALCKQMDEHDYSSVKPKNENILKKAFSHIKQLIK